MKNKKAIFFDLDGTLLPIDLDKMFGAYFDLLKGSKTIKLFAEDEEEAFKIFSEATRIMMRNQGSATNDAVFYEYTKKRLGREKDYFEQSFDEFYGEIFNSLAGMVQKTDVQREIIDTVLNKGYVTVLATMPVFPVSAAKTRLGWIDLHPGDFSYISHYENSSYVKPHLQYYQEILHNLELSGDECIMIGNNVQEDMCAEQLGFDVFLVSGHVIGEYGEKDYLNGDLHALLEWLRQLPQAEVLK